MSEHLGTWVVLGALLLGLVAYFARRAVLLSRYRTQWQAHNSKAFREQIQTSQLDGFDEVETLVIELRNRNGGLAVLLNGGVHQLNEDLSFVANGPFFPDRNNWVRTGRRHIAKVLRGRNRRGFASSLSQQSGLIRERGVRLIEVDSQKQPPVTIFEFTKLERTKRDQWNLNDP